MTDLDLDQIRATGLLPGHPVVPALCDEVERLRAENEQLQEQLNYAAEVVEADARWVALESAQERADAAEARLAAAEKLIDPASGMAVQVYPGSRYFDEQDIRRALASPAPGQEGQE